MSSGLSWTDLFTHECKKGTADTVCLYSECSRRTRKWSARLRSFVSSTRRRSCGTARCSRLMEWSWWTHWTRSSPLWTTTTRMWNGRDEHTGRDHRRSGRRRRECRWDDRRTGPNARAIQRRLRRTNVLGKKTVAVNTDIKNAQKKNLKTFEKEKTWQILQHASE